MYTALRRTAAAWQRLSRRAFLVASVATLATAAACSGDDDDGGPDGSLNGTYNLTRIDGDQLPVSFQGPDGDILTFQSGSLTLSGGRNYTATLRTNQGNLNDSGTFRRDGDTVEFDSNDEDSDFEASLNGNTLNANLDISGDSDFFTFTFTR